MSQTATMFSPAWSSAFMLLMPMPPKPIIATFSVRLGARYPTPPGTWRGTIIGAMAKAAAAVAPSRTNVRREMGVDSSVIARDPVGAGTRNWNAGRTGRNGWCAVRDARCAFSNRPDAWRDRRIAESASRIAQNALFPSGLHGARHQTAAEPVDARQRGGRHPLRHVAPRDT